MNVREVVASIETLPPMPAVAVRLLEAAQNPTAGLSNVASWIERDPSMTANLLRLCNSPLFGLRREVRSVRQAVTLLGMKQVVQVALTVLSSRYLSRGEVGYGLAAGDLWKNSIVSALAAELIALETHYSSPSTAYMAGLLQDLGKIVLAEFVGGALPQIMDLVERHGLSFEEAEQRVVGMTHSEVGALLLERWDFPSALVEAVRTHHRPADARIDPALARISHLADAFAMTLGLGVGVDGLAYDLDENAFGELVLSPAGGVDELMARLGEKLTQAGTILVSPRDER